jgi:formate hydrogenlyase subunit 3/multisubunit Na+/H+ antiporter MnhD subunit
MGYIIFGFASVSVLGIMGSLLHIINHAIIKSLLFLISGVLMRQTGTRRMRLMGGLITRMPITGTACLIAVFSLVGAPPLNAFWSEWMIFGGGLASGLIVTTFIGVLGTVITAGYLLWFVWRVFFGEVGKKVEKTEEAPHVMLIPIIVLSALCILFGIWPGLLLQFVKPAADILGDLLSLV